ncbi:retinoblastoma-like protein 2 isoform X2 [Cylas formicarius]|uniref:retinoblastoma-like protein 2 isoform X2 n=1 Tax=Cylas formicarius TaxID=197179 RepID=UPI0029588DA1|nr:retinoblastoma-like protein 2 isoform X2 [Cylas formicarius]
MVLAGERDDELFKTHQDLCSKLNLDENIITTSWETFESINKKFVLEGEKLQWLGCSIYVACCSTETPTLDTSEIVRGSGVNLTSLLRHSNLSFVQFFSNISKWLDMVQLSDDFRNKVNNIRSTFSVAYNTFKKYLPSFVEIFVSPIMNSQDIDASKHRNRKMRPIPYTSFKIFEFIWNMFILLKSEENYLGTELIKCHHLLYCCIDLALRNVLMSNRRDLVNPNFVQEFAIANIENGDQEWPCIVTKFCNCDSVIKEALHMKIYTFRDLVHKLIRNGTLVGNEESFNDILSVENFDSNFRSVTKAYEAHLLSKGDFDERIFLAEYKRQLIEKEQLSNNWTTIKTFPPGDCDTSVMESPRNSVGMVTPNQLLDTPLTGRKFLGPREADQPILGDKSLSEKMSRLHALIVNRCAKPSESLQHLFSQCQSDPSERIERILLTNNEKLIEAFLNCGCSKEDAQNYLDIGVTLFYKYVESVLHTEKNISAEISALVEKDLFFQCMFVCCMEMVFFSYNFSKKFPWILETLEVKPIHFVKVIELIVRSKDHLFRELIKHLNRIEETVMESLAWRSDSPIWDAIANSDQGIPRFEDIALPGHLLHNDVDDTEPTAIRSPGLSAVDCFQSPISQVSRNLFPTTAQTGQSVLQKHTHLMIPGKDGNMKIIPIVDPERTKDVVVQPLKTESATESVTPRKTGSLMLIFRKFYNLAGVRLQHLCLNLGFTDFELKRKIWTIFEDSIRHTDLIKDRHLDQLLMCAIYVICKACNINNYENLFAIIMKFYRQQPQASSSVYRDVLIERGKIEDGKAIPEKRNDLIQFYNSVYVKAMQAYAIRFQPNSNSNSNVLLSPLPAIRRNMVSPNINTQVVGNVFVKPLESSVIQVGSSYNYFFSRSPSKELKNINRAINNNVIRGKRLLGEDVLEMPSNKRISNRKIQSLVEERRSQNLE